MLPYILKIMLNRRRFHLVKHYLLVVAGLNLGVVGIFQVDLFQTLLGASPLLIRVLYVLIGSSAILDMMTHQANCKLCLKKR